MYVFPQDLICKQPLFLIVSCCRTKEIKFPLPFLENRFEVVKGLFPQLHSSKNHMQTEPKQFGLAIVKKDTVMTYFLSRSSVNSKIISILFPTPTNCLSKKNQGSFSYVVFHIEIINLH